MGKLLRKFRQFAVYTDGKIEWGNGSSLDTSLYRSSADSLRTDDAFTVGMQLNAFGRVFIANPTAPATPTGGGVLYVEGGALTYKGSSGTVTSFGNALTTSRQDF
ncbi:MULTISPECIES: hypothetical protein [unclassified Micromonospora]|uniref:hypothetical protein n=1 Tax=unclassified Micromonospora TaxID=2617518 RepID=UPI002FF36473